MSAECDGVLARIYSVLDGEATLSELTEIQQHLEACPPCLDEYEVEAALKALVRRVCSERAPAELRARIVASMTDGHAVSSVSSVTSVTSVTQRTGDSSTVVTRVTRTTTVEG